uniref:Uncharacterized protein n=1 Tax=Brassica oleracea var. oleracea TaxID=109376 RepID=A0A0D3BLY1_BRAOL
SSFSHNSLFNHTTCSSLSTKACSSPKLITVAQALLTKVGWRLLHDTKSLWAKFLRNWMVGSSSSSSTWKSVVMGIREVVLVGHSWVTGNGRNISGRTAYGGEGGDGQQRVAPSTRSN